MIQNVLFEIFKKKLAKLTIFGIFNELLSTQNVSVARFARNVEWDFFCDFQTSCNTVLVSTWPDSIFTRISIPIFAFKGHLTTTSNN